MLIFLIDGFNLFHKIGSMRNSPRPRNDLVAYIRSMRLTGSVNNKVVIVFDGHDNGEVSTERDYHIVFSRDRTADAVIKSRIEATRNRSQLVVVSDDREIRDFARGMGVNVKGTADFLAKAQDKTQTTIPKDEKEMELLAKERLKKELEDIWTKKCRSSQK